MSLSRTLRQFAEQNWCVADTLSQTVGGDVDKEEEEEDSEGGIVGRRTVERWGDWRGRKKPWPEWKKR